MRFWRVVLVCLVATRAEAQRITGVVRDSGARVALSGAVVATLDARGASLARVLTDVDGHYSVAVADSATQLRVVRIGFQPRVIAIATPRPATIDVAMLKVPTLLFPVTVSDERLCSARSDRAAALALWEQAHAGLLASIVAREATPAIATLIAYERTMDNNAGRVIRQKARKITGRTTQPFVAPVPPAELAKNGYLGLAKGERTFSAPDADVLLDESFAGTHCFGVQQPDSAHPGAIGLAFEPARGRDRIVDVRGTLWLDAGVPALRAIEFGYVGGDARDLLRDASGTIHFRTMGNGVVFVDDWKVRIPVMKQDVIPDRVMRVDRGVDARGMQRGVGVTAIKATDQVQETGGLVLTARWTDGTSWKSPLEPVSGVLMERGATKPMSDALVAIEATGDTIMTDEAGRWAMFPLFTGRYEITALDTSYSAFISAREKRSMLDVPVSSDVRLELPGRASALRDLCRDAHGPGDRSVLLGRVVDVGGRRSLPIPGGTMIRSSWLGGAMKVNSTLAVYRDGEAITLDDRGRFSICDVPREIVLHLAMSREGVMFRDTSLAVPAETEVQELTWRVDLAGLGRVVAQAPGAFRGRVVDRDRRTPLVGVDVWLPAVDQHATTDSAGAFSFDAVAPGQLLVQLRRLGYEVRRDTLRMAPGVRVDREYSLGSQGTALDTVRTVADAVKYAAPQLRAFEERRANHAAGYFIPEAELRKHDNEPLANVILSRSAGLRIVPGLQGAAYLASSSKPAAGPAFSKGKMKPCFVTVYIDGVLAYSVAMDDANDPMDFSRRPVSEYAGVEFYPRAGTGPPGFNATDTGCGLLMLWTREK